MEARPPLLPPSLHDKREHDYHIHGKHHFYEGAFFTIGTRKNYHYILETGTWRIGHQGASWVGFFCFFASHFLLSCFATFLLYNSFLLDAFLRTFRCFKSIISIHALYDGYNESLFAQQSLSIDTSGHCPM